MIIRIQLSAVSIRIKAEKLKIQKVNGVIVRNYSQKDKNDNRRLYSNNQPDEGV
jgi:hypothetical protein